MEKKGILGKKIWGEHIVQVGSTMILFTPKGTDSFMDLHAI